MKKLKHYWLSSRKMTVSVVVLGKTIIKAAPVIGCFVGQPLSNLCSWMRCQGEFKLQRLDTK